MTSVTRTIKRNRYFFVYARLCVYDFSTFDTVPITVGSVNWSRLRLCQKRRRTWISKGFTVICDWSDLSSEISCFICREIYARHRDLLWYFVHYCFYHASHAIRGHVYFCFLQLRHLFVDQSRTCADTIFQNLEQNIFKLKCPFSSRLRK